MNVCAGTMAIDSTLTMMVANGWVLSMSDC